MATATIAATLHGMSLFPDLPPPTSPPAKPKLTPDERRARQADRLTTIRLRMLIGRELDKRGITMPARAAPGRSGTARGAGAGYARRRRRLGLAVVAAGPGALPDASTTQDHLGTTVAAAAPPTVSYLARAAGGRLLGSLDHQQMAEPHAGEVD
jgi:hypothetical protein